MQLLTVYRAPYLLNSSGVFQSDPWMVFSGRSLVELGFGSPPSQLGKPVSLDGVVFPGLVNSYCRLGEHSPLEHKDQWWDLQKEHHELDLKQLQGAVNEARSSGTFFLNHFSSNIAVSRAIHGIDGFRGVRFYDKPDMVSSQEQVASDLRDDHEIIPALHSLRLTTEEDLDHFLKTRRKNTHVVYLGANEPAYDHDINKGQLGYLQRKGFYEARRVMLVEPEPLSAVRLKDFGRDVPLPGVILLPGMASFMQYSRSDIQSIIESQVYSLLGSGSLAVGQSADMLKQVSLLRDLDVAEEKEVWKMATANAYDMMELRPEKISFFVSMGSGPSFDEILASQQLRRLDAYDLLKAG